MGLENQLLVIRRDLETFCEEHRGAQRAKLSVHFAYVL